MSSLLLNFYFCKYDDRIFCYDDRWMAPLLLLLDLFEKISVISQRKAEANTLRVSKILDGVWFNSLECDKLTKGLVSMCFVFYRK